MDCLKCFSTKTKKHGILESGAQRYHCHNCEKTFTIGGRGTYSVSFKEKVIENYCHRGLTSRELIKQYSISSRTLVKWAKEHKKDCSQCSKT